MEAISIYLGEHYTSSLLSLFASFSPSSGLKIHIQLDFHELDSPIESFEHGCGEPFYNWCSPVSGVSIREVEKHKKHVPRPGRATKKYHVSSVLLISFSHSCGAAQTVTRTRAGQKTVNGAFESKSVGPALGNHVRRPGYRRVWHLGCSTATSLVRWSRT